MKIRLLVALLGVLVVAIVLATMLIDRREDARTPVIRVGYLSLASSLPFFVAEVNGYFEDEGIEVQAFNLESSNEVADALLAGRINATSVTALSVWMSIEQRQPHTLKIFLMTYAGSTTTVHRILARQGSGISDLSQLEGKTIGMFPGLQMKVFTELILGRYFNTESLDLVPLSPPLQKDALASGRIDALFCLEPVGTVVENAGIGYPIAINPLYTFILRPFPTAASVFSTEYLRAHPVAVKSYVQAIYKAVQYIEEHPKEAREVLPDYTSLTGDLSQKVGIYDFWTVDSIDGRAVQHLADIYQQHGILEGELETGDLYLDVSN